MSVVATLRYRDDVLGCRDEEGEDPDAAYNDMYYMGKGIPSRSFHLLQSAVGQTDAHAVASEKRRRRRKAVERQHSQSQDDVSGVDVDDTEFEESAYLAGQVLLNVSAEQKTPRAVDKGSAREVAPWQKPSPDDVTSTSGNNNFDEEAYLSGRVPVINDAPKQPIKPLVSELMPTTALVEEPAQDEHFDESDYLAGRISLLGGEAKPRPASAKSKTEEEPDWVKKRLEKQNMTGELVSDQFEAMHHLKVQIREELQTDKTASWPRGRKLLRTNSGCGHPTFAEFYRECTARGVYGRRKRNASDPGQTEEPQAPNPRGEFDEDAYLEGKVPLLRESVDRELPPRVLKPKQYRERASWERSDEDGIQLRDQFDENHYLAGRVPTAVRTSVERESPATNGTNNQFATVPSRTFHYLRRSMSREGSPSSTSSGRSPCRQSSFDSGEDENDPNKVYSEMMYQGKHIPSKTFLKLKKSVSRRSGNRQKSTDPIENMRMKVKEDVMIIDHAMDNLNIDIYDPDKYLTALKESVQASNNIKIEADSNEMTDF